MAADNDVAADHATTYGSPGERARFAGLLRAVWPLLGVSLLAGYLVRALFSWPPMSQTVVGFSFILLAAGSAFVMMRCIRRVSSFVKGARGEERAGLTLAFLPGSYTVFNGVCMGRGRVMPRNGDFDHIVVGPTGLYVVETKNWGAPVIYRDGKLLFEDGREPSRPPLEQTRAAVELLKKVVQEKIGLDIPVHGVVCFVGNRFTDARRELQHMTVCNLSDLLSVIRQPRLKRLDDLQCNKLIELFRQWVTFEVDEVAPAEDGDAEPDTEEKA